MKGKTMSEWIVTNMEFSDAWVEMYGYKRLVRCKDCKHFGGAFWCRWYECGTGRDGYCHHGERKDDESV